MLSRSLLVASTAAFSCLVTAQNFSTSPSGELRIVPNSVPFNTREQWCNAEKGTCPILCGGLGNTQTNNCNEVSNAIRFPTTATPITDSATPRPF
jgi:hypothetical protein